MRSLRTFTMLVGATMLAGGTLSAQATAHDPSDRLREVLPADVADHVLAVIAAARSHGLPAAALTNRALKFAARGVNPQEIERSVAAQARRMQEVSDTLEHARGRKPAGDEVDAGAEAMRQGVDGAKVSALAKSAPSGRSLAVPLFVIGSLVDRGLPSDSALARVLARLQARATDGEIERMNTQANGRPTDQTTGTANRPANPGSQGNGGNRQGPPATTPAATPGVNGPPARVPVAGPPAGVPANGGKATRPTPPATPPATPGTKRP